MSDVQPMNADSELSDHGDATNEPMATDCDAEEVHVVAELEFVDAPPTEEPADAEEAPTRLQSVSEARAAVEALLFATNEPLTTERISKLLNGLHPRSVQGLVTELQIEYDRRGGGLQISEVAGGFQMATRAHIGGWLAGLHKQRRRAVLSPATLETLTILAYKQPMTRAEIEAIRGVDSSTAVRTLIELGLIEVHGHREVLGRPQLYITTGLFLKAFGLRSLADLPSMAELKQLYSQQRLQEEAREEARRVRQAEKAEKARRKAEQAAVKASEGEASSNATDTASDDTPAPEQDPEEEPSDKLTDDAEATDTAPLSDPSDLRE